ncbi:MAG TPA: ATP-binding protein [Chitinophagaceae bacterium]|nr:ATP-binding protein [Chitinophagaceae bacterium]
MEFSEIHFGKNLNSLSYSDIQEYFKIERNETDSIEYKSISDKSDYKSSFQKITETICGFLNSSGGILIWGAPNGRRKDGKKEKYFQGELTPTKDILEKDTLINKIASLITPLPNSINVTILHLEDTAVYVIEVKESDYAPHQTNEKYFIRIDGQTRVAPHHYVEAMFKKARFPNIEGFVGIQSLFHKNNIIFNGKKGNFLSIQIKFMIFNWSPFQNEEDVYVRLLSDFGCFQDSLYAARGYPSTGEYSEKVTDILSYGSPVGDSMTLFYDKEDLRREKNQTKLILSFGGRLCPAKTSVYNIDFSLFEINGDIKKCLTPIYKNTFFKDLKENQENTKEDILVKFGLV